jgi:hypothetical protein
VVTANKRILHTVKTWIKVLIVTVVVAVPAMILGPIVWPPAEGGPEPTAGQLPFFIFLAAMESVLLGLGVSFLIFGFPLISRISSGSKSLAWTMYLAIGWFLVSGWPHDNLHVHVGDDMQGLLYIEYGFHVTLMICGLIVAYGFLAFLREGLGKAASVR